MVGGTYGDTVTLVQALVWPAIVLAALIALRPYLPGAARGLAARISRVSVANLSVDLVASEVRPELWNSLSYLRDPTSTQRWSDSNSMLFTLINSGERADSAVIDLGAGKRWLTSRLYIFSSLLPRLLGVRCLVFLETRAGIPRCFVGLARPAAVSAALARREPWLEQALVANQLNLYREAAVQAKDAFSQTLLEQILQPRQPPPSVNWNSLERPFRVLAAASFERELPDDARQAEQVANNYLNDPLLYRQVPATAEEEDGWVRLGSLPQTADLVREEHASWISDGVVLERLLREALVSVPLRDDPADSLRELQRKLVLAEGGDYIAVVDPNERFRQLYDRHRIVERIARDHADRAT